MATKKPATTNPFADLPAPTLNKPAAGDVFRRIGQTFLVMKLDKGAASAECYDLATGNTKSVKRSVLETAFDRVSPNESAKIHKELVKAAKAKAKAKTEKSDAKAAPKARKPRAKKANGAAANPPAPGPNPALN